MRYKRLEEYGIIGNLETCALVGKDGSIDWLCFPYIGSPSVLAALLDSEKGGHFRIAPVMKYHSTQSYDGDTNILLTNFATPTGDAVVTDFMPVKGMNVRSAETVVRKVECTRGVVRLAVTLAPRFDYARAMPDARPAEDGILFNGRNEFLYLQSPVALSLRDGGAEGFLLLRKKESLWFLLHYNHRNPLPPDHCERMLAEVKGFWLNWAHRCASDACVIEEPWHSLAVRSGLALKLLSNPDTGAIAAAATTSLPESLGGARNWDYRYSWIRDTSFTDQALFHLGHVHEARHFRNWLIGVAGEGRGPSGIMTMYDLHGEGDLQEQVLEHLSGYEGSRPVRTGNAAATQRQLDIFGEVMSALYDSGKHGEKISKEKWKVFKKIIDYVCEVWDRKDSGIWEVRGEPRHFVYSKLMCWVAVDRGLRLSREKGFEASLKTWERTREEIRQAILDRGFSRRLNSFVQDFDSEVVDATGLLISPMGFLPHDDKRVLGTIEAVRQRLTTKDGLVYRSEGRNSLPGKEGCFLLCSFWLVNALILSGKTDEAEKIFMNVLNYASPLGLLSEEVEPESGRLIGNFPQALSHVGVINSALYLGISRGRRFTGPSPLGI